MRSKLIRILIILFAVINTAKGAAAEDVILKQIDFVDASAADVVQAIAERGGYDIATGSNPLVFDGRRITLHMKNVPCLKAIDAALKIAGLKYQKKGNSILISALSQDILNSAYAPDPDAELVQVLIEGKVVEVSESGIEEIGIKWGREVGKFKFIVNSKDGSVSPLEDLLVTINGLVSEGKAEVLAEPCIVAIDGHEALINIGSRIPYAVPVSTSSGVAQWTVEYIDAGVSLKICPMVGDNGKISVSLEPEVSSVSEWRVTSAGEFPVITTRNAKTEVVVKDGETIIIGGLTSRSQRENVSKIAFVSDIPVLGGLFQSRVKESAKTEIVFLITPRLL